MLRSLVLLLLVLFTTPLFAQWEQRFGVRAGFTQYRADGFRIDTRRTTPAAGVDYWLKRGRFALDLGVDGYKIREAGNFTIVSADAQLLLGPADGPQLGIGIGPNLINEDGNVDFVFVPSLSFQIPAGKQQVYVIARRHTSSANIDGDAETSIFMAGVRFSRR